MKCLKVFKNLNLLIERLLKQVYLCNDHSRRRTLSMTVTLLPAWTATFTRSRDRLSCSSCNVAKDSSVLGCPNNSSIKRKYPWTMFFINWGMVSRSSNLVCHCNKVTNWTNLERSHWSSIESGILSSTLRDNCLRRTGFKTVREKILSGKKI